LKVTWNKILVLNDPHRHISVHRQLALVIDGKELVQFTREVDQALPHFWGLEFLRNEIQHFLEGSVRGAINHKLLLLLLLI
jgi:hypothetical protein